MEGNNIMNKRIFRCALAVALLFAFAVSMGGCALSAPQEKEFSKDGMTITLTNQFAEKEYITQTVMYESRDSIVTALKESFSALEEAGLGSDITPEEYAELVIANNMLENCEIQEKEGLTCFQYDRTVDGKAFSYLATIHKAPDAFWLIQFGCLETDFPEKESQFIEWAKTVKV